MICSACGHQNDKNRFCVQCGTPLAADLGEPETAAASEVRTVPGTLSGRASSRQANDQIEQAKMMGRQYFAFFGQVLRRPFHAARTAGKEQFLNGAITVVLLSLLYPLLVYIGLSKLGFGAPSFGRTVIQPAFYFLIIFALIAAVILGVLRISSVQADYRTVTARFGTMLVPGVLCAAVSCLLFLIDMGGGILSLFFSLGLIFLFVSISATILSFDQPEGGKLDALYALVIANVASGYIFFKVIDMASNSFGRYFTIFGGGSLF